MATANRPSFCRLAVTHFLRQTYTRSELIVVDDGETPVDELCPRSERVRHIRLTQRTATGTKLNVGIEQARGSIIQKLDDDDYYHPDFLAAAAAHLPADNRESALVAWDCFLVLLPGEARLRHSGRGWAAGGTFCFGRELWDRVRFRDVMRDEDEWLLKDARPDLVPVCSPEHYILVRHGHNTWKRFDDRQTVEEFFLAQPEYERPVESLIDPDSLALYRRNQTLKLREETHSQEPPIFLQSSVQK